MNRSEETIGNGAQQNENTEDTSAHPMDAFLEEEAYGLTSPRRGEVRTGTIARKTETDVLVDIGYKSEGLIPGRELERLTAEQRDELVVGTEVTVYVLRSGGTDGTILLSISRAEEEKDWIEAENLMKSKEAFESVVSGYNKGGLIVKLGHLRGFIPASQVSMARRWRADGDNAEQRWGKMVGEPIVSKVIEVERRRNRLILSERAAAREARDVLKERLIEELQLGEIRTGHVISLADFGAFVDIGGADGLVHTSEISWRRINHPRDVLKVGQEVQVKVLGVDRDQKRISLSMRELEEDPWEAIVNQYKEGQLVEGTITKLTKFGAFASLKGVDDYELEGLVHISELSDRHIVHPREVVGENETLTLRVIKVDRKRRRIGLSLKKVDSPEFAELDWQAAMVELRSEDEEEVEASPVDEQPIESEVDEAESAEPEAADETPADAEEETEESLEVETTDEPPAEAEEETEESLEVETADEPSAEAEEETEETLEVETTDEPPAEAEGETEESLEVETADEPPAEAEEETEESLEVETADESPAEAETESAQEFEAEEESMEDEIEETEGSQDPEPPETEIEGEDDPVEEPDPEDNQEAPEDIAEEPGSTEKE